MLLKASDPRVPALFDWKGSMECCFNLSRSSSSLSLWELQWNGQYRDDGRMMINLWSVFLRSPVKKHAALLLADSLSGSTHCKVLKWIIW